MSNPLSQLGTKTQIDNCTFCPKMCRHSCPVSTASGVETHTPQSKMTRIGELETGRMDWSTGAAEPLWACTGCRQCTNYCKHGNEPGLVLFAARARANARGFAHPALENYPDRFRRRDQRLAGVLDEMLSEGSESDEVEVGFWPGCDAVDKNPADIRKALELFEHFELPARVVRAQQVCGGYPLLAAGYTDMFRWHAAKVAAELRRYRTVILGCSACVYTMRSQYPAEGIELSTNVLSLAEYLESVTPTNTGSEDKPNVYYHDPCYLSHYVDVIEQPRRLLANVARVREFTWSKTDADCCGGGGLLPKTMPKVADSMARRRLRDIAGRGGGTVVTACATCAFMLRSNAPGGVEVRDLADFLHERLKRAQFGSSSDEKP